MKHFKYGNLKKHDKENSGKYFFRGKDAIAKLKIKETFFMGKVSRLYYAKAFLCILKVQSTVKQK